MGCCASKKERPQQSQPPINHEHIQPSGVEAPPSKSEVKQTPQASSHPLTKGQLDEASRLAMKESYIEAIRIYQQHIENDPEGGQDIDGVGMEELGVGDYQWYPLKWYKQSIEGGVCKGTSYDALSLCYGRLRNNQEQIALGTQWYLQMVDERPNSIGLLMGYANILSNQGQYDQALCYYDRVQHLKPSWVRPLECQCLLEDYKKGEKSKSMELARKILGLDEENKIGLFVSARNQETVEGKIAKLKELVAIYPKYARGFHELGLISGGEKQEYKEAISWYQEATELTPSYCSCYNNIGINYELLKNTDQAMNWYLRGIEQNKNYKAPHKNLSYIFSKDNYSPEKVAIKISKYNLAEDYFYYYLGIAYYERKKYPKAIQFYTKALECSKELGKEIYKLHNAIAIVHEDQGQFELARKNYEKSIDENRQSSDAYYNMAILHRKQGNAKESLYWSQETIKINPRFSQAYNNIGDIYREEFLYEQAIHHYQRALELAPTLSLTLTNLAVCYFKLHSEVKAFACVRRARLSLIKDRQALSKENKAHLEQILQNLQKEGDLWKQKGIQEHRVQISNILRNYQLRFSQEEAHLGWEDIPVSKKLRKEMLQIIGLLHDDQLSLINMDKVYELVRDLSKENMEYFHIIPRLYAHYYYAQCLQNNRPVLEVEKKVLDLTRKMGAKAKEECGKVKESKSRRTALKLKHFEGKGRRINLFKTQYFKDAKELFKELMAMRDTANRYYPEFKALVTEVSEHSFGTLEVLQVKIPMEEKDNYSQLLEIFQKMFQAELSKDRLQSIIRNIDESLRNELKGKNEDNKLSPDELMFKIMEVWIQTITAIVAKRTQNSVETRCEITDLISACIKLNSFDHLKRALEGVADSCYASNYEIIKMENRLAQSQHEDVLLLINVGETVCTLSLSLKQDSSQQELLRAIQQIETSPLGVLFGSFITLGRGTFYSFHDNCEDIVELLRRGDILKDAKSLTSAEYVLQNLRRFPKI